MKIAAVAFDLDGTLYPNSAMYAASFSYLLRNLRVIRKFAKIRKDIRKIRPIENFHDLQANMLAKALKISLSEAEVIINDVFYDQWEQLLKNIKPFKYLRTMLENLKTRGIPLGILSDFPVKKKLGFMNLDGFWKAAFCSEEAGYLKPNLEPFIELAKRLETPIDEILYVGNSYQYDIIGAKKAGMKTAHLTRRKSSADISFIDYRQLEEWILQ